MYVQIACLLSSSSCSSFPCCVALQDGGSELVRDDIPYSAAILLYRIMYSKKQVKVEDSNIEKMLRLKLKKKKA